MPGIGFLKNFCDAGETELSLEERKMVTSLVALIFSFYNPQYDKLVSTKLASPPVPS